MRNDGLRPKCKMKNGLSHSRWQAFLICHLFFSPLTPHLLPFISYISFSSASAQTLVELNCENLFDCRHDSLKQDAEWLPGGQRRWSPARYWRKLNHIAQEILSCREEGIPDLVALVEVENDTVLFDLTRRSLLRGAGYDYLMTESPDVRGIDVALLYHPFTFRPLCYDYLSVVPHEDMRPTRDILYVCGETLNRDTLHVFVVHAPSRYGGERQTRPSRRLVAERLVQAAELLPPQAKLIVAGDFNDNADSPALRYLSDYGLHNVTASAQGTHGAQGTYRYEGRWQSIDHIFVSNALLDAVASAVINDAPFLLEEDKNYGGVKPYRTYVGYRYQPGFSDHLPLVVRLEQKKRQEE